MPVVQLTLIKGYSAEFRRRISEKITDLVVQLSGAVPEGTTVTIQELDQSSYMRGREQKNPIPPAPPASQIVLDYLAAMEARDLDKAKKLSGRGIWMEFPGAVRMTSLEGADRLVKAAIKGGAKPGRVCRSLLEGEDGGHLPRDAARGLAGWQRVQRYSLC